MFIISGHLKIICLDVRFFLVQRRLCLIHSNNSAWVLMRASLSSKSVIV